MLKFWTSYGTEETATILAKFQDNEGEWYYVVPPHVGAHYDRRPRIITPAEVIGEESI